jgi:hypothetical protein
MATYLAGKLPLIVVTTLYNAEKIRKAPGGLVLHPSPEIIYPTPPAAPSEPIARLPAAISTPRSAP